MKKIAVKNILVSTICFLIFTALIIVVYATNKSVVGAEKQEDIVFKTTDCAYGEYGETNSTDLISNPTEEQIEEQTEYSQIDTEAADPTETIDTEKAADTQQTADEDSLEEVENNIVNTYLGRFTLTAYCSCSKCCGIYAENRHLDENGEQIVYTASGAVAKPNHTIAVDPKVIPYGTAVSINGNVYVAEDCGGGIKGNHIDVYFESHEAALQFGRQSGEVYLIG